MKKIAFIILLILVVGCTGQLRTDVAGVGETVPTGPDAITWDGKNLIIAKEGLIVFLEDIDLASADSIYNYEGHYFFDRFPITITSQENTPFITALAWQSAKNIPGGGYLWVADTGNKRILKVTPQGDVVSKFNKLPFYPEDMTFDGEFLWVADSKRNKIFKVSTEDCAVLETFISPVKNPSGIAWDGRYIIIIGYKEVDDFTELSKPVEPQFQHSINSKSPYTQTTIKIVKLDPQTGQIVREVIPSRHLTSPVGMVYVEDYLWISDRNAGKIFRVQDMGFASEDKNIYKVETPVASPKKLEVKTTVKQEPKDAEEAKQWAEEARKAAEEARKAAEAAKKAFELQQKK